MRLNTKADSEDNEYILSYLPKIKQETFTVGAVYRHYAGAHVQSAVVSHSYLNNRNTKYRRNDESHPDNLMLRLRSTEQETKLRLEKALLSVIGKSISASIWITANIPTLPFNGCTLTSRKLLIITRI